MLIDFNDINEITTHGMNNGTGKMSAKMFIHDSGKIIHCKIQKGGSIGIHQHQTSDDINYVLSGKDKAICDGIEEDLNAGCCHICKKGSEHSIINTGDNDISLLAIVVER